MYEFLNKCNCSYLIKYNHKNLSVLNVVSD